MDGIRDIIIIKNLETLARKHTLDQRKGLESIIRTNAIFGKGAPH